MRRIWIPDAHLRSVFDLDLAELRQRGIRGLVFDLDNTLGPWGFRSWDPRVQQHLEAIEAQGFRIGFASNGDPRGTVRPEPGTDGRPWRFGAGKPGTDGLREVLTSLELAPHEAAMVGDQIFTDVWSAKRLGMHAILVRPVDPASESPFTRLKRGAERLILQAHGLWHPESRRPRLDGDAIDPEEGDPV